MPVGSDNISMQGIAVSGSFEVQTNISLQTIWTTFVTANPSGGNLKLNDMANKDYPTTSTNAASSVTQTSMTCNANVTSDGGVLGGITQRGFYFGTNANYASNTKTSVAGTTGAYTLAKTSLTAGTTYYITGYAKNALGERQGSTISQATTAAPSLTSITILTFGGGSFEGGGAACEGEEGINATMYHDGSNSYVVVGDKIYTTNGTSNPLGDGYYRQAYGSKSNQAIIINSEEGDDGEVIEVNNC
tara:strand:- start:11438 stop:12175 length:738 start_codon:yes stop_codon:yes gene_type:complete